MFCVNIFFLPWSRGGRHRLFIILFSPSCTYMVQVICSGLYITLYCTLLYITLYCTLLYITLYCTLLYPNYLCPSWTCTIQVICTVLYFFTPLYVALNCTVNMFLPSYTCTVYITCDLYFSVLYSPILHCMYCILM